LSNMMYQNTLLQRSDCSSWRIAAFCSSTAGLLGI
jgi:hypothetical protein